MPLGVVREKSFLDAQPPAMRAVLMEKAYIANILPLPWPMIQTYGTFLIPACPEGEPFVLSAVNSYPSKIDLGDNQHMDISILAADIADDLVRQINSNAGEDSFLGVFRCSADGPTEKELANARRKVDGFFKRLIGAADKKWQQTRTSTFISDIERMAASFEGYKRDWNLSMDDMTPCPACGSSILATAATCKECGVIVDIEKWNKFAHAAPATVDSELGTVVAAAARKPVRKNSSRTRPEAK